MFRNFVPTCAVVIFEHIKPCGWLFLLAIILADILVQYNSSINIKLYPADAHMARWHHSPRKNTAKTFFYSFYTFSKNFPTWLEFQVFIPNPLQGLFCYGTRRDDKGIKVHY